MEEQLQRHPHDHHQYEHDPQHAGLHSVIEDDGEQGEQQHHKSVLKKVKDKAKKIKDTIKKHGHGHEHEHGHEGGHHREDIYQEGYEEEEEEEDEEMVNDPEVHGAPIYESTAIKSTNLPTDADVNVEKKKGTWDDSHEQNLREEGITRHVAHEFGKPPVVAAHGTENKDALYGDESENKIGPRIGLEEDPHSPFSRPTEIPRPSYQSSVADPIGDGGKEVEVGPLASQFDNLNVHNEVDKKPEPEKRSYTGTHDQFAPQETSTETQINPESDQVFIPERPGSNPEVHDIPTQNTIAEKISAAATAAASTTISAKNAIASKLGYGGGSLAQDPSSKASTPGVVSQYTEKAADKLTPVYESVAGASSALLSKFQHGDGDSEPAEGASSGGTVQGYLAEKFRPGDEDKALSEVIKDVFTKKNDMPAEEGRVRQSEKVTARLGPVAEKKREGEDALAAGAESSGQGVVDRLKDAVGGWLGKSTGIETAQEAVAGSYVSSAGSATSQEGKVDQQRG